jgi:hypothetical protein
MPAENYTVSTDWDAKRYCGITLEWNYLKGECWLSMPGYVKDALHIFQHPRPKKPQHAPSPWTQPIYGKHTQMSKAHDTSAPLNKGRVKILQKVVGKFLFYARAVDNTMLHTLNCLASQQTKGNQTMWHDMQHFLDYAATNPNARLRFVCSDMILRTESDASYLTEDESRSRSAAFHYLGKAADQPPFFNGPILPNTKIIRAVMSSAAEAETGSLFLNLKDAVVLRTTLEEMGHPQPADGNPCATDNSTAAGIVNRTVKQQRSKAIDMRFYWVRDRVDQKQFRVYWAPGRTNLGDYYSKHHSPAHHLHMRPVHLGQLTSEAVQERLRGCDVPSATRASRKSRAGRDAAIPDALAAHVSWTSDAICQASHVSLPSDVRSKLASVLSQARHTNTNCMARRATLITDTYQQEQHKMQQQTIATNP